MDHFLKPPKDAVILHTSHSEIVTYCGCRRKHYYAYGRQLELNDNQKSPHRERGTRGHSVLELFFKLLKDGHSFEDAKQQTLMRVVMEVAEFWEASSIAITIPRFLEDYEDEIKTWEILHVEETFEVHLGDGIYLTFIPDLVIRVRGQVIVVDFKFTVDFATPRAARANSQLVKYAWALTQMGYHCNDAMLLQFRTRDLKNIPRSEFVRPHPFKVNAARQAGVIRDQLQYAKEVGWHRAMGIEDWDRNALRTLDPYNYKGCEGCDFFILCMEELEGKNWELAEKSFYHKRKPSKHKANDTVFNEEDGGSD